MDAALACLFEYGYSGTTMAQVSDRAGVSRGAPHHHYGSKSELMAAAVKHLTEAMISTPLLSGPGPSLMTILALSTMLAVAELVPVI